MWVLCQFRWDCQFICIPIHHCCVVFVRNLGHHSKSHIEVAWLNGSLSEKCDIGMDGIIHMDSFKGTYLNRKPSEPSIFLEIWGLSVLIFPPVY